MGWGGGEESQSGQGAAERALRGRGRTCLPGGAATITCPALALTKYVMLVELLRTKSSMVPVEHTELLPAAAAAGGGTAGTAAAAGGGLGC